MTEIEPAVTIKEIMIATGKSQASVYRMLRNGDIPSHHGVGGYVVPRPLFRRYLDGTWTKRTANQPADFGSFVHKRDQRVS